MIKIIFIRSSIFKYFIYILVILSSNFPVEACFSLKFKNWRLRDDEFDLEEKKKQSSATNICVNLD